MPLPYLLFWLVLAVIGVANGVLRGATYGKAMGNLPAHQLSTLTGCAAMFVAVWLFHRRFPIDSSRTAWTIGLAWLAMTIAFEFVAGHYLFGNSWEKLLADYNLARGRIWSLMLIWLTVLPAVVRWLAGR